MKKNNKKKSFKGNIPIAQNGITPEELQQMNWGSSADYLKMANQIPVVGETTAGNQTPQVPGAVGAIKSVLPNIQIGTAGVISGISGMVNYMDSLANRRREQEQIANQLRPVQGGNDNFYGNDMPIYQANGGEVPYHLRKRNQPRGASVSYDTPILTPAQEAALNTPTPYQQIPQQVAKTFGQTYTNQGSITPWAQDSAATPFTRSYKGSSGSAVTGPNYSGQSWSPIQVPISNLPGEHNPYGPAYIPLDSGEIRINTNKVDPRFAYNTGEIYYSGAIPQFRNGGTVNGKGTITPIKQDDGYTSKDFEVDPSLANVLAEKGEFIQFPDNSTTPITGDRHSAPSGGEYLNIPEGSRIYSDKLKADKEFASDLLGKKVSKKYSMADLAKKFNTDKEEKILNNKKSSQISNRTAEINKELKKSKLQEIFDYQEMIKNPQILDQELMNIPMMADGGEVGIRRGGLQPDGTYGQYTPEQRIKYLANLDRIGFETIPDYNPIGLSLADRQARVFGAQPGSVLQHFNASVPPTNFGVEQGLGDNPTAEQIVNNNLADGRGYFRLAETSPQYFNSQEDINNFIKDKTPIGDGYYTTPSVDGNPTQYYRPVLQGDSSSVTPLTTNQVTPLSGGPNIQGQLRTGLPGLTQPVTPQGGSSPKRSLKDIAQGARDVIGGGIGDVSEFLPEAFMAAQALNDFPIFTSKFQPVYTDAIELNVQDQLNRNYAQASQLLNTTGNPSVANARAQQTFANLYDANNQVFNQKYNFDTQNRQQTQQYNNQLENQANLTNIQRMDDFWNKVTARQSNKEQDLNTIVNSAYGKAKAKAMEKRSLQLANQTFENYQYDPSRGMEFVPVTNPDGTTTLVQRPIMATAPQSTKKKK